MSDKLPAVLTGGELIYESVREITNKELAEEILAAFEDFVAERCFGRHPQAEIFRRMRGKYKEKLTYRFLNDPEYEEIPRGNVSHAVNFWLFSELATFNPELWMEFRRNCLKNKWIGHRMGFFSQ